MLLEKQIENLINVLGCSEKEAIQIIEADRRIEKGEKLFELDKEGKEVEKKMKSTGTKAPTVYQFKHRERKVDSDKREIIQTLDDALCNLVDDVKVINQEREIEFYYNNRKFKLVLSCPRS